MSVVALMNHKGGVGKSLVAVHLAVWLHEQGLRIALIDADGTRQSSRWVKEAEPSVAVTTLVHPKKALQTIRETSGEVDFVVVDGAGGDSEINRLILLRSDLALIPCGPNEQDLDATMGEIEVLKGIQDARDGKPEALLIPNKLVPGHRFSRDLLNLDGHGKLIPFTQHNLRLRAPYAEAFPKRTVTWRLPHKYAEPAAKEVILLMEELHGYITNGWPRVDRRQAV
jgi:chromosome partitioning protein